MTRQIKMLSLIFVLSIMLLMHSFSSTVQADMLESNDFVNETVLSPQLTSTVYSPNYFYSDFDSTKDYYTNTFDHIGMDEYSFYPLYYDDGLQIRANCYGYAIRAYYGLTNFTDEMQISLYNGDVYQGYKQWPGEFANKRNGLTLYNTNGAVYATISNYSDLTNLLRCILSPGCPSSTRMSILEQLLEADAAALGYSITEYTSTILPDAEGVADARMIALVAAPYDFHFYMQHSDNTWSHKPGWSEPTNQCLNGEVFLTNSNIREHALEGLYLSGDIKFYYVTKNAIVDFPHMRGSYTSSSSQFGLDCVQTTRGTTEHAGNYFESAKNIGTVPRTWGNASFDYIGDIDYYAFEATSSSTYSFNVTANTDIPVVISATLYDDSGNYLCSSSGILGGNVTFSRYLLSGATYILKLESFGQTTHNYFQRYSFDISN